MKATVRDPDALRTITPFDLVAYLSIHGWTASEPSGDKGAAWVCAPERGKEYEILVPLRTDLGDYVYRIADALATLEVVEQRSPLEILFDLTAVDSDVTPVRVTAPDTSDEFLAEVKDLPHRNLAIELLRKLLNNEIKLRFRRNAVQARSFREMLEQAVKAYHNRAIEAAQIITELIELAREMRQAGRRGEQLGLTEDEIAFYDALETNDSAVQVLGDETLRTIARELAETVRRNVAIDWTVKESVRAKLRVMVKRVLLKYGYPPDKREKATQTVLDQAELIAADWAVEPRCEMQAKA